MSDTATKEIFKMFRALGDALTAAGFAQGRAVDDPEIELRLTAAHIAALTTHADHFGEMITRMRPDLQAHYEACRARASKILKEGK